MGTACAVPALLVASEVLPSAAYCLVVQSFTK
jgi:hypothetical protein